MRQGTLRDKFTDALDEVESGVGHALDALKQVDSIARYDVEAVEQRDIVRMQEAITDAGSILQELKDALY